ncbi:helix-turn-helix domain-containing protein [Treponema sp. C6A8]|uniref:helix-turn-helix domain-containing protein n=1 Tax=Treponema sp. C6A8 TaxID=1410609 RepID=UPI0005703BBD|nr:helix-turn-helix transcriptional regulator [Treponema sp. C6A8]
MGFKENLKEELSYQGILVKELAEKSGVPKGTIDHYLAEKCTAPIAENAVKIAQALEVSVEYLVTGKEKNKNADETQNQIHLYKKYSNLIALAEKLDDRQLKAIENLIESI